MSFLTRAEVHDCMSDFSSSMTAALQANSIVASSPKSVLANGQTAVNQVVRCVSILIQDRAWSLGLGLASGDRRTSRSRRAERLSG